MKPRKSRRRVNHHYEPSTYFTPKNETVKEFLSQFGSWGQLLTTLQFAEMPTGLATVYKWAKQNSIPREAYSVLVAIADKGHSSPPAEVDGRTNEVSGFDVYIKDVFVGKFDVPRGVRVIARRRKLE